MTAGYVIVDGPHTRSVVANPSPTESLGVRVDADDGRESFSRSWQADKHLAHRVAIESARVRGLTDR